MKNIFLCLAVALLSSCIPVEDFGTYWKKGTVDPALVGTWIPIASPEQDDDRKKARTVYVMDKKPVRVANQHGTYQIDSMDNEERHNKNYVPVSARTLAVGRYTFLMVIDKEGAKKDDIVRGLVRYKFDGNVFRQYSLADGPAGEFLKEKHLSTKNISKPDCKDKKSAWCLLSHVYIKTLDGEVLKILAQIPDTKEFWTDAGTFSRQVGPDK